MLGDLSVLEELVREDQALEEITGAMVCRVRCGDKWREAPTAREQCWRGFWLDNGSGAVEENGQMKLPWGSWFDVHPSIHFFMMSIFHRHPSIGSFLTPVWSFLASIFHRCPFIHLFLASILSLLASDRSFIPSRVVAFVHSLHPSVQLSTLPFEWLLSCCPWLFPSLTPQALMLAWFGASIFCRDLSLSRPLRFSYYKKKEENQTYFLCKKSENKMEIDFLCPIFVKKWKNRNNTKGSLNLVFMFFLFLKNLLVVNIYDFSWSLSSSYVVFLFHFFSSSIRHSGFLPGRRVTICKSIQKKKREVWTSMPFQ